MRCKITYLITLILFHVLLTSSNNPLSNYVKHYEPTNQITSASKTHKSVSFRAFNRHFYLTLHPQSTFLDNPIPIKMIDVGHSVSFLSQDIRKNFLIGHVRNNTNSTAVGICVDSAFQGTIRLRDDIYHIEAADRYFPRPVPFQSIVFKQSDIFPRRPGTKTACNQTAEEHFTLGALRESRTKPLDLRRNTVCTLKLFADHTFFTHQTEHEVIRVVFEMIFLLQQARNIFGATDFDGDGTAEEIGFQIKAIQLVLSAHAPNYRLFEESLGIEEYLDLFADYDFDKFCLGLAVTRRRFDSGALGITYTASPSARTAGGICQKRRRAKGQVAPKNYNTVVVTVVGQDGRLMPRFLSGLTLAHELGHAFGSDHDSLDDEECSPKVGDYLMSPYTLLGREVNNYRFSPCSRRQIAEVLREKGVCFVQRKPMCGNAIVESGEECDCGTPDQCATVDPCCTPKGGPGPDDECTVRASQGFTCSSVGKPCCSSRCQFVQSHETKDCTGGNDCFLPSTCTGFSADCPPLTPKLNGAKCRHGLGRCFETVCEDVICSQMGLLECVCEDLRLQCQLCCKYKNGLCKPASVFGIWRAENRPYRRPSGEDCDDGRSFCNSDGQCTAVVDRKRFVTRPEDEMLDGDDEILKSGESGHNVVAVLVISVLGVSIVSFVIAVVCALVPVRRIVRGWLPK